MSSDSEGIGHAVIFFCVGVFSFFWGFQRLRRKRKIENIPTSTVRSLAMGIVELTGKTESPRVLKSPLTNAECTLYRYVIEEYRSSGKSGHWVTIAKGDSFSCFFWLNDGTGKVMVLPRSAEFIMPVDYEFSTRLGRSIPPNLEAFMDKLGIKRGRFFKPTLRFKEWYLKKDDKVYIMGTAKKTESPTDYQETLMSRLRQIKADPKKMAQFDLNKDGQVDMREWNIAVDKIEQELIEGELKNTSQDELSDVGITKGDMDDVFIISDYSQKDLIKKLSFQVFGGIFGGAALALFCLFILLAYFMK